MKALKLLAPATLGVFALILSAGQAQAAGYTAVDLHWWPGSYPGSHSFAWAINNGGQVAGHTNNPGGFPQPTLWSGGSQSLLANYGVAHAINDSGVLAGHDSVNAVVWSNGSQTVLPSLGGDGGAYGINNSGQVVGYSVTSSNKLHATFWDNGSVTDLGTLGGATSFAFDINNPGQIVGVAYMPGNYLGHAALWENGSITDLGDLGYGTSTAWSISESGRIVGSAGYGATNSTAVLWENGVATTLPSLSGTDNGSNNAAYGINNAGLIVGSSHALSDDWYASLWQNGTVTDLNTLVSLASGVYLREARGINDLGQIIANGSDGHAYLLTPDAVSNVPVPAAGWLFGSVLLGALGLKRRRPA